MVFARLILNLSYQGICPNQTISLKHTRTGGGGGGGGGRLLVSCVPVHEQKNDEKGYFFTAGQYAALSSFRVGKNAIFVGKGYVF